MKNNSKDLSYLLLDKKKVNCKIGAKGIGIKSREGDFITPKGVFSLERVFFREDKVKKPRTSLQVTAIKRFYFWCSDPRSENYNKLLDIISIKTEMQKNTDELNSILNQYDKTIKGPISNCR